MDTNYQDKKKVIEYLSVIRDAEINKQPQEMDEELIKACVGLLLYVQDKNDDLTPEQIDKAVEKIPFVDTEKTVNTKNNNKRINKLKLLLIAAIIPIILTILTLMATADIEWLHFDTLKELFQSVANAPAGETFYNEDTEFGRVDGNTYETPKEFYKDTKTNILIPGKNFKQYKLTSLLCLTSSTGNEIYVSFDDESFNYTIYVYDNLQNELNNVQNTQTTINDFDCYIVELKDIGQYQVYFNHNGYTYRINHSDLDVIIDLIENMEEIK